MSALPSRANTQVSQAAPHSSRLRAPMKIASICAVISSWGSAFSKWTVEQVNFVAAKVNF